MSEIRLTTEGFVFWRITRRSFQYALSSPSLLSYISMPYDFEVTSSTPSHSFQADETRPTTSAAASTSQPAVSELLANMPLRKGSPTPLSVGLNQGNAFSAPYQRRTNETILERINAYSKAATIEGSAKAQRSRSTVREGLSLRQFVNTNGVLNFRGEQLKAAVEGHKFCRVTPSTLMLWTDESNHLSMEEFAKRFGLYKLTLEKLAKPDHTLNDRGLAMLRQDQGHQFAHPTIAQMMQFQQLCSLPETKTSLVDYCRDKNLNVTEFKNLMRASGTPTKAGERRLAAAARNMNRPPPIERSPATDACSTAAHDH